MGIRKSSGSIINFPKENEPVKGCTISEQLFNENGMSFFVFSMAEGTSISAENYEYHKIITVYDGDIEVFASNGNIWHLGVGDSIVTAIDISFGIKSKNGCVFTEISLRKDDIMNEIIKSGEVFRLGELLPYQEGKIVNMDLVSNDKMKFVIMSFDAGTGLSEHAAPGEALVFALDGEAVIGYEGKDYLLKAGETFKFDKLGKHSVKAESRFKMALLLVLD